MEEIVYHTNFELEDNYWWFTARNKIVFELINKFCSLNSSDTILDVGCGTGGFAKILSSRYSVICLDNSPLALEYCRKRGLSNLCSTPLEEFPKDDSSVKTIVMLDVIEHIDNDAEFVKHAYNILSEGGRLIATVPAYMWLWSEHDEVHKHFRRYTKSNFTKLIEGAGFKVKYATYFNTLLFLPAVIKRFFEKLIPGKSKEESPVDKVSPFINKIFNSTFSFEGKILPKVKFPFGLSIIVIAEK